jgi:hypothetical protein
MHSSRTALVDGLVKVSRTCEVVGSVVKVTIRAALVFPVTTLPEIFAHALPVQYCSVKSEIGAMLPSPE